MPQKRDKTTGLPLPSPVDPGSTVCFQMTIPDAPEYRQALRGVVADLGKYWTWSQTVGESSQPALEAAELWRAAAQTIVYDECGGGDMSCDDVADCIESDEGTRAAIQQIAGQASQPGTTTTPGQRLPDSTWAGNLTPTDDCDPDVFWAQCSQFVDYLVTAGADFLEQIEVYSNAVEAAEFIEMIPALGTIIDEAQIDKMIEFVDWVAESMSEWYVGADTQPNREDIACALFCDAKNDCELTLDGAFEVINQRAGGIYTPSSLESVSEWIDAAIAITTNPALPLDTWIAVVLGFARVAGYLGVRGLDATLNIVLKVAVNDANDDWILLCEDCPEEPCPDSDYGNDFRSGAGGFEPSVPPIYAEYFPGEGWGQNPSGFSITIEKDIGTLVRARFYTLESAAGAVFLRQTLANGFATFSGPTTSGTEGALYWYEWTMSATTAGICLQVNPAGTLTQRIVKWCGWAS